MIRTRERRGKFHHYARVWNKQEKRQEEFLIGKTDQAEPDAAVYIKLGEVLKAWEDGLHPNAARMLIGKVPESMAIRYKQALTKNVLPFFGRYTIGQIDDELCAAYCLKRWGSDQDGRPRAVKSTWAKERRALKQLINVVVKGWELPEIKTVGIVKPDKRPLTIEQIKSVAEHVPAKYKPVYWIMAYTGMDIGDALTLAPEHIKDMTWISKPRGKTASTVSLPIGKSFRAILKSIPEPMRKPSPFLSQLKPNGVKVAVKKAFARAGLEGYSSKDLRRSLASRLLDAGYTYQWIAKALGHAPGSNVTERYAGVFEDTLREAFEKIEKQA